MKGFYEKEIVIAPSHCDATSKLSLHAMFVLCQDIASEHAELLGIGGAAMAAKGLFWLTVRTRIQVYSRPWMMQQVKVKTWLGKFTERDLRTDRYYRITCGDRLVAEGRTEWSVLRVADQTVVRMREVGIPDVEILEDTVCQRPFSRFNAAFTEADEVMEHTVLASDVDMGQHMNNTAYVRAVLDTFTVPELKALRPAELEICFRSPCYGGDRLTICRKQQEDGWLFAVRRPDGKQAVLAQLLLQPEKQNP